MILTFTTDPLQPKRLNGITEVKPFAPLYLSFVYQSVRITILSFF